MEMKEIEKQMKALANGRRLAILKHLKKSKDTSVGEIADAIKLSFKATSKHLIILYAAGIVEKEQDMLIVKYSISGNLHKATKQVIAML